MADTFLNKATKVLKEINTILTLTDITLEMEQASELQVRMVLKCSKTGEKVSVTDAISHGKELIDVRTTKNES